MCGQPIPSSTRYGFNAYIARFQSSLAALGKVDEYLVVTLGHVATDMPVEFHDKFSSSETVTSVLR